MVMQEEREQEGPSKEEGGGRSKVENKGTYLDPLKRRSMTGAIEQKQHLNFLSSSSEQGNET
eukprot:426057-Hanusia_phi.AAC.1